MIAHLKQESEQLSVMDLAKSVLDRSGYQKMLEAEGTLEAHVAVRGQQVSMEKDQLITVLTLPAPSTQARAMAAPVLLNSDGLSPQVALRRK